MNATILWADDEIDLLKPHVLFLEEKGYKVIPVQSGRDALDELEQDVPDIVFLDEQMPGLSGLDTLSMIKERWPQLPVVMITKSEEEHIMEDALGGKISDYLIKPVNPNQILLTVKKHTEMKRLQSEKSTQSYQQRFREIGMQLSGRMDWSEWEEMYRRLVYWELELSNTEDENIHDIFLSQKEEANRQFCRYYEENYVGWLAGASDKPTLSPTVLNERLFPLLKEGRPTFLIVIDNFRYDQWKFVQPTVEQLFKTERDDLFFSILPTTTQFARNAMFAGLMPSEIERKYPQYWVNEDEEGWKNQYEHELLDENLRRHGLNIKHTYSKVLNAQYDILISHSEEALKKASDAGQLAVLNKELFSDFNNAYMKYSKFSDYVEADTNYGTTIWIGISNKLSNMQRVKALDALQGFVGFAVKQVSIELG